MENTIEILIKNIYGENRFYPQCQKSDYFAKIAKTKTLTRHNLSWIEKLGYQIKFYSLVNGKPYKIDFKKEGIK